MTVILSAPKRKLDPLTQMQQLFEKSQKRIKTIDAFVPVWPKISGSLHTKNTEYPYEIAADRWKPPCDPSSFTLKEVSDAHSFVHPFFHALDQSVSALERMPP